MMYKRFTQRALQVLRLAQEEAVRLKHGAVGTEHILLGLLREGEGIAAKALEASGVVFSEMEQGIEELIGTGSEEVEPVVQYTPRAKKVLELSLAEARRLNHSYVGTEHILLALIREGEGVAARVLNNAGISLNKARQQVLQLLGTGGGISSGKKTANLSKGRSNITTLDSLLRDLTGVARGGDLHSLICLEHEITTGI